MQLSDTYRNLATGLHYQFDRVTRQYVDVVPYAAPGSTDCDEDEVEVEVISNAVSRELVPEAIEVTAVRVEPFPRCNVGNHSPTNEADLEYAIRLRMNYVASPESSPDDRGEEGGGVFDGEGGGDGDGDGGADSGADNGADNGGDNGADIGRNSTRVNGGDNGADNGGDNSGDNGGYNGGDNGGDNGADNCRNSTGVNGGDSVEDDDGDHREGHDIGAIGDIGNNTSVETQVDAPLQSDRISDEPLYEVPPWIAVSANNEMKGLSPLWLAMLITLHPLNIPFNK